MKNRIFISRNAAECQLFINFCKTNQLEYIGESLIEFESIPFVDDKIYDIVFFSSIRAAQYYLAYKNPERKPIYACVGNVTANKLLKLGIECEFIGKEAGNPEIAALEFKKWIKNKIVFFPRSDKSIQTFPKNLAPENVISQCIYKTNNIEKLISKCHLYIFTSPSNLDAFLITNEIPVDSIIISWGTSTTAFAKEKGLIVNHTLNNANEQELIELIEKIVLTQI